MSDMTDALDAAFAGVVADLGIGVDLDAVRGMVTELFKQAEAVDHE